MNKIFVKIAVLVTIVTVITTVWAVQVQAQIRFPIHMTTENGVGETIGSVSFTNSDYGLLITPDLVSLTPGAHGFHIHSNPACGPAEKDGSMVPGLAAGGHLDPQETGIHAGPYENGHLGALPLLYADADGKATTPVLAPRLRVSDVLGRSIMIHLYGDNYSDDPIPLGGGGPRFACGVLKL